MFKQVFGGTVDFQSECLKEHLDTHKPVRPTAADTN